MDSSLKQRLVGIAVIFALAVIFLPMILDGSGIKERNLVVDIPQPPIVVGNSEFKEKILELEERVEAIPTLDPRFTDEQTPEPEPVIEASDESKSQKSSTKVTTEQSENKKPEVKVEKAAADKIKKTGGESWVLQVASFTDRSKAIRQRDSLRKSKVAAVFVEAFKAETTTSYRVRLGPFLTRDEARVAQNKIKAKHNLDGLVMKYER